MMDNNGTKNNSAGNNGGAGMLGGMAANAAGF